MSRSQDPSCPAWRMFRTDQRTEPGVIPKKLRRSALVKRPLPSAMFAEIHRDARFNWSTRNA